MKPLVKGQGQCWKQLQKFCKSSHVFALKGWRRGDMKRFKGAAADCSWARRRKLGET